MSSVEIIIAGLFGSLCFGWAVGRGIKAYRQFFETL